MTRIIALAACALLLPTAGVLRGQSLADLAKREKERREKITTETKVITNHDTHRYRGGAVTTMTLPPPAKPAEEKLEAPPATAKADEEPTDLQGRPESFWRQTMTDARKKVHELENEANVLVLKLADLQNRFYREDSGFKQQDIQREIQKTLYEQDLSKENLAKAKDQLADLEKEARRSGALPGWLTGKNP